MILSCPSCGARYLLNPHQLGEGGRRVKCARCHHVWFQQRPADTIIAAPPPSPPPSSGLRAEGGTPGGPPPGDPSGGHAASAGRGPASHPERVGLPSTELRRRRSGPAALWLFLVLLIGAAAAVVYAAREDIVRIYPPAIVVYDWLDIPLDRGVLSLHEELRPGLAFADIAVDRERDEGGDRLVISGRIVNDSDEVRGLAPVYVHFLDAGGAELASWRVELEVDSLAPDDSVAFAASGRDFPANAATVDFRMAD